MLALISLLFAAPLPAATAASYSRYVTIAVPNPQPMPDRPTLNFPGSVANFGTRFEFNQTLDVDLFLPPGSKYLCGDYDSRKLTGTNHVGGAPEGENWEEEGVTGGAEEWEEPHVEDWLAHIPTLPMTSDNRDDKGFSRHLENVFDGYPSTYSTRPIALLASRGICPFEIKARKALAYNRMLEPSSDDGTARHPDRRIKYVIVYNDDPSMGESLVTMGGSSSARSLDVGMIFVSKKSGSAIETSMRTFQAMRSDFADPTLSGADYRIPSHGDETIGEGLWTFPSVLATPEEPTPYNRDRNGSDDDYYRSTRGGGGGRSDSFYWIRFVLFSLLIVAPCTRGVFLWYQAGGRVRFRRDEETGRVRGLEVIRPLPRWYRGRMENMMMGGRGADGDGQSTERRGKLTKDQVMELPEIEYRAADEGGTDGAGTETAATAASSGGSGLTPSFSVVPDPEASAPPESALAPIPVTTQGDTNENSAATSCTSCSICIEDFEEGEKLRFLPKCKHAFHTECIMPWLTERQGCCPLCKTSVLGDDDDETDNEGGGEAERSDDGERGVDVAESQTDIEMGTATTATGTVGGGRDDDSRDNVRSEGGGGQ